jgi:FkbM family methyltransferase
VNDFPSVDLEAGGRSIRLSFASENDHIARMIRQTQAFYEAEMLSDARSRLFFPRLAVDVGAHIGNHTVYFAQVLGIRTISFEPNPASFFHLDLNIRENGLARLCRVRHAAVGRTSGLVRPISAPGENSGMARVEEDPAGTVPLVTLDDELVGEAHVDLLKIDVEGWELGVLEGAHEVLRRHRPLIYVEVMEDRFAGVEAYLRDLGYVCWKRFNATPTFLFLHRCRLGAVD